MAFSTVPFLFLFLPLFLFAFVLIARRNPVILLFSIIFFAWSEGLYLAVLLLTVWGNYLLGNLIFRHPRKRPLLLKTGVTANLLLLGYFKYFGFVTGDILQLDAVAEAHAPHLLLGVSFFTFHAVSYLIDISRGHVRPARSLADFTLYIIMFPKLIAGPIVRFGEMTHAIHQREITLEDVRSGLLIFVLGLSQKVLIADNVAQVADFAFNLPPRHLDMMTAWAGAAAYTLQIFHDFAGYSLMAIGLGRIMGFSLPANFNYPYVSRSIGEFWRRWHITLSSWLRDYIYIPLGGSRRGRTRTCLNIFIVFVLCGLWHGAAWTFVAWGTIHALLLIIERLGLKDLLDRLPTPVSLCYTLLCITCGWVFFRAGSLSQGYHFLTAMFFDAPQQNRGIWEIFTHENLFFFLAGILFATPLLPSLGQWWPKRQESAGITFILQQRLSEAVVLLLFAVCLVYIMAGTYSPFIYFQF